MGDYEIDVGLRRLMREAEQAATWRGHVLDWEQLGPHLVRGTCVECGMDVDCNALPKPNEIDIGGEAVALNCPGRAVEDQTDFDVEDFLGYWGFNG